ncbi:aminopeptidase N [Pseudorhodobacter sp. MZDSW-24AT]|uniref:aminopeptidase N n=1 Tax=Pseudorhodobacter sp. MZDSW-24AT TaxID=2052957 RepID=UPI000C1E234B|nr:aminopeptidase N [Pseudorhodobacter sp. MZDSW-24AT]PJF10474.1 aminopeptidase N [Pseudorhodobacter sp. MZDSW-24AT]
MTEARAILLSDYQPFSHLVDQVTLTFHLAPQATRVMARLEMRPNPAREPGQDLRLDGEGLRLLALSVDGRPLAAQPDATGLTLAAAHLPDGPFVLETEVEIAPEGNTALEGLYMSRGMYCTQCEAEGFRKITFYPDRPDVMARFRVRVEGDLPVLLSNGNPVAAGPGWAEWDDPWPKPAYLFALVAGDLRAHSARFRTMSGRDVALNIWVRPGDEQRCAYAMDSLIRSMRWDEEVYGREYDLDVFNIVAVDDFNMGAMENKGLNIFNSKFVLASPETATDDDFARIEAIIAHEYFHNWTGNRITCRDWFQLCLKEGLTVYRDQQFSGDMRSAAVKRIEDVLMLRARQFREDQGPLAHAVRPDSYMEINNFYTATIYEKGAEVIGMLRRLVGAEAYARALDLYFERHDGEAATIEDWLRVFEDATGRDLTQFKRWYTEAGTPLLKVRDEFNNGVYTLHFEQENPATPGQPVKGAKVLPIAVGLLNPNGDEVLATTVLEMTEMRQSFRFEGLATRPVPSLLRGFSAPVVLERETPAAERAFLLAHDTDPFNKWEAGRALAKDVLARMVTAGAAPGPDWLDALARVALDESLDPAFRALCLRLPSEDDMAQTLHASGHVPDPAGIYAARRRMGAALAQRLGSEVPGLIAALAEPGGFSPDARAAGRRALRLAALSLLSRLDDGAAARAVFAQANNMTEEVGALACLLDIGAGQAELARFETRWSHDRNVMDKWFALQIAFAAPERAVEVTRDLTAHPAFDWKNPNRFRAVIGALAGNHAGFHHAEGGGYDLVAEWLLRLDPLNPQTAARMSTAFETWRRYDADRQAMIRAGLRRMLATEGLSRDLTEMAGRMLGE